MKDYLIVGKITGSHGIGGDLKFLPLLDDASGLKRIKSGYLFSEKEEKKKDVRVSGWKLAGDRVFVHLEGIESPEEGRKLSGLYLGADREVLPALPEGRFYISDLAGCRVVDVKLGDMGSVKSLLQTGANDVFVVGRQGQRDLLIPYLNAVVLSVNTDEGVVTVSLPEGLLEIYE